MTRLPVLYILLALAKLSGIVGIIAAFAHHRTLGGSLLAVDAVLLAIVVINSYRATQLTLLTPIPGFKDYPPLPNLIRNPDDN